MARLGFIDNRRRGDPVLQSTLVDFSQFYAGTFNNGTAGQVTRGTGNWGSGAYSTAVSLTNAGDYFEFEVLNGVFIVGLTSDPNPSTGWNETNVGIYRLSPTSTFRALSGSLTSLGLPLADGATVRMTLLASGEVEVAFNGTAAFTSPVQTTPLYPHFTSGGAQGSGITNAQVVNL